MPASTERPAWQSRCDSAAKLVDRFQEKTGLALTLDSFRNGQDNSAYHFFVVVPTTQFQVAKVSIIKDQYGWFFSHPIDLLSATVLMIQESAS